MTLNDAVRIAVRTSMIPPPGPIPCLEGMPGCGKTAAITTAIHKHDPEASVITFHASQISSLDSRGLPHKVQETLSDDTRRLVTVWTVPALIHECMRAHEQGRTVFLFLDELLQAELDTQKALRQLLSERRIGEHNLPPNTRLLAASNRIQDRAGVNAASTHLTNVLLKLPVEWNCQTDWVPWATRKGLLPTVIDWAEKHGPAHFAQEVPSTPNEPFCTPRSLTYAEQVLRALSPDPEDINPDPATVEAIAGLIGPAAAGTLVSHTKLAAHFPSREDVLTSPDTAHVPETRPDVLSALVHWVPQLAPSESALAQASADSFEVDRLPPDLDIRLTAIVAYTNRLPQAWRVPIWTGLCLRTGGKALSNRALQKAASEHTQLISEVLRHA